MASTKSSKKALSQPSISNFLSEVVGSTKTLVDNVIETAGDAEKETRKQAQKLAKKDVKELRKQTEKLNDQIRKLANFSKGK
jgi:predicted transcriptional regulator